MSNKIHDEVKALLEEGATIGKVSGFLSYMHDFGTKQSKELISQVREELGLVTTGCGTADWSGTVTFLRANFGRMPKKDLIHGMCKENGKTFATNQHAYNYIAMAQEWAAQQTA